MYICVEIGGTKTQVAVIDEAFTIQKLIRGKVDREKGRDGILHFIKDSIVSLQQEFNNLNAVAVGFGGPIVSATGSVLKSVQVKGWSSFPLKQWFEEEFRLPAFIYNDSSAAGYGEYKLGSGKGTDQFFYTNLGTGIGGSLIINGKLYDGQGFGSAEFGHLSVISPLTGRETEVELFCSGPSIEKRLNSPGYIPSDSYLYELSCGNTSFVDCKMLGTAANNSDKFALSELDRIAKVLGTALSNLMLLMQVEKIAIGGGVSLIGKPLFDRIITEVKKRDFITYENRYDIVPAELGENIVLLGAAVLASEQL